jgi:hypothetical protein
MEIFKKATRQKLRVQTPYGLLSVEQLWDMSLTRLASVIKDINSQIKEQKGGDELSFLEETPQTDSAVQLAFDVLKEIYTEKKKERDAEKIAADTKAHNEEIMSLIYQKEKQSLGEKSIDELKAMLK